MASSLFSACTLISLPIDSQIVTLNVFIFRLLCLCERAGLVPYASSCFLPVSADQPLTAIQGLESLRQLPESKRHLGLAYPSISIYSPKLLGCQEQNNFFSRTKTFFTCCTIRFLGRRDPELYLYPYP
jgi:hypothetical protein